MPPCAPWSSSLFARAFIFLALVSFLLPLFPAAAQDEEDDATILIDTKINYGVAYRDNAWTPVDVFVNNTERDVEGFVEVRTFDFSNNPLSPVYRLPVESPKGSRKQFRLYCKFERANRMEVQLYNGNRPAVPVPSWLNMTPIERKDYLGLILDDQHHDYGFLSSGEVIGREETRFHREGLATDQLGMLADNLPCYTAFDLIVMGNIDPERIPPEQRALIGQYVALGGTLAINLGENAARYKGSWLEPLMGVTIGENAFTSESDLAARAFPGAAAGAQAREGMATAITPANETVESIGSNFVAGAIHRVGAGRVATFTVDAKSTLLQENGAYLGAWNRLLANSIVERPLNLPAVINAATVQLPEIAGVRLFPISSVIAYLLLYFAIAIVANWLFWNWMKRREMAWVCLVFFSFAFTGYAMIFGTQGRARTTQLEQLEVLEMRDGNSLATLHGVTGLLAKGSGRFAADLIRPQTLVTDAASAAMYDLGRPRGVFGPQGQNPFHFVQGEQGRIENLTVGASEMRFLQTQAPLELPGAIEAELSYRDGKLHGTITNNTGLALENPFLMHGGRSHHLIWDGTIARVTDPKTAYPTGMARLEQIHPVQAATVPEDIPPQERQQFTTFLSGMPQLLFSDNGAQGRTCLVAWVDAPPQGSVDMGSRAELHLGATLAITWLDVDLGEFPDALDLPVAFAETPDNSVLMGRSARMPVQQVYVDSILPVSQYTTPGLPTTDAAWDTAMRGFRSGDEWAFSVDIPKGLRDSDDYALQLIVVYGSTAYEGSHGNCSPVSGSDADTLPQITLRERDRRSGNFQNPETDTITLDGGATLRAETYTLDNWRDLLAPRSSRIDLNTGTYTTLDTGTPVRGAFNQRGEHYHAFIAARMIKQTTQTAGE